MNLKIHSMINKERLLLMQLKYMYSSRITKEQRTLNWLLFQKDNNIGIQHILIYN